MSELAPLEPNTKLQNIIVVVSIAIPILVAVLIYLPASARINDLEVSFIPHLNAVLNSATAICLVISLWAILNKKIIVHRTANLIALGLSTFFLIGYVLYHYASESTVFGDINGNRMLDPSEREALGSTRALYLILLLSHIALATVVVPFVLFSFYYSLTGQFAKHKRLSRFTWPLWFYVAVSGVIVYWMINPYYLH